MSSDPAMADGLNWYRYANNNPIMYRDPTGMWIDNGDGTHTAEEGDTLHGLYGDNWEEESGWDSSTRPPENLQIGETVGKKRDTSSSDGGSSESSESEESASSSTQESRRPYIPNDSRHNPPKEHGNNLGQPTNPPPSVSQPAASVEQIEQSVWASYLSKELGEELTSEEQALQDLLITLLILFMGGTAVAGYLISSIMVASTAGPIGITIWVIMQLAGVYISAKKIGRLGSMMGANEKKLSGKDLEIAIKEALKLIPIKNQSASYIRDAYVNSN